MGAVVVDLARADVTADEDPSTDETVPVRALGRGLFDPSSAVEEQRFVSHSVASSETGARAPASLRDALTQNLPNIEHPCEQP
ncbi:hypothetical protein CH300_26300 [Rhodococcus sp. 15-1154-1]|nr:hypothetical protein CH300_26300 [Rhodococcus sp. 15-1154-1]